ncbi:hypothetical protein ACQEVC_02500 [Plantactinospora sp. CA-294935]|uniref:hypothetical protein n=1 Tax=Plantactinospora sp. CA-294935 TaxID=3240012 RepID=UPI003D90AFA6
MMGRILGIELRRSAAVGVALLSLVVSTAALLSFPQGFAGRWMQLAVAVRLMLMLSWPLALAGGAWLGRRDARSRVDELFASTARPRWQRVLPTAAALAVTLVAGYALTFLVAAAWVIPTAGYFPVTAIAVTAVGALSVVAAGWLGMAVGRAVPRLVTPPALAVAGVALAGLLPDWLSAAAYAGDPAVRPEPAALLLTPVYLGELHDFQTVVARVNLTQALWLAALAATGLLLFGAVGRRAVALAVLPAVLGAAVAVPLMPTGGYDAAAAVDPDAVELVCDEDGPQVCVTRVHAGLLPDVVGPARQALAMMAAKLPDAPVRAVESQQFTLPASSAPSRPEADTLVFPGPPIGRTGRADVSGEPVLLSLLKAAWQQDCADGSGDSIEAYLARVVAAAWLTGQPPALEDWWASGERSRVERAYQALVGLPQDEQRRRMAAAREAVLDCRSDALLPILPRDTL